MDRRTGHAAGQESAKSSHGSAAPTPDALHETGLGHLRAGRILDAQVCCQQALAIDAHHADTLHLLGLLSLQTDQYDNAIEWISRAVQQAPKPGFLTDLGNVLLKQGRNAEAISVFDKLVQLHPGDAA